MAASTGSEKIHPSKRDAWLVTVLATAGMFSLFAALVTLSDQPSAGYALLSVLFAAGSFVIWMFTGTFYVVTETELLVRSGPFRWSIPLRHIQEVHPTRNPLSSPALSLDRLGIRHAGGYLMISPEDKRAFLDDLVARTPGLVLEDGGAIRRR